MKGLPRIWRGHGQPDIGAIVLGETIGRVIDKEAPEPATETHVLIDSVLLDWNMSDQILHFVGTRGEQQLWFEEREEADDAAYNLECFKSMITA